MSESLSQLGVSEASTPSGDSPADGEASDDKESALPATGGAPPAQ